MSAGRILITGAGGFVGGALATGFAALGWDVVAVDGTFDDAARARLSGCDIVRADLASAPDLPAAAVIVHAAALTTGPDALGITPAAHVAANMVPLLAMLEHAARVRPAAFVFLSSSGVFAATDGSPDLTDTDPATAQGPYSAAKRAGEALVSGALGGLCETFCVRLGYLYGPHEAPRATRRRVSMIRGWLDTAAAGGTIAVDAGDPRRDWTWTPDLAPALAALLAGPGRAAPIHLCNPETPRDSLVADRIARLFPQTRIAQTVTQAVKPPMVPSALPALDSVRWTGIDAGLTALAGQAVAA